MDMRILRLYSQAQNARVFFAQIPDSVSYGRKMRKKRRDSI